MVRGGGLITHQGFAGYRVVDRPPMRGSYRGKTVMSMPPVSAGRLTLLQVLMNLLDYEMNVAEATHAPRIHQPWRSPELVVKPGIGVDSLRLLEERGHQIRPEPSMGSTQAIVHKDRLFYGAADPRRPGGAAIGVIDKPR